MPHTRVEVCYDEVEKLTPHHVRLQEAVTKLMVQTSITLPITLDGTPYHLVLKAQLQEVFS